MNASGRLNTCKSRGSAVVAILLNTCKSRGSAVVAILLAATGERVRNA